MGSAKGGVLAIRTGRTLKENLKDLIERFPVDHQGYFGSRGRGKKGHIRNIVCDNPGLTAAEFASIAATSPSVIRPLPGKGLTLIMRDGGRVTHRWVSSSDGTPVVELSCNGVLGIADQKIHFVPKGKEKR